MSADFVPGWILRLALASRRLCSIVDSAFEELPLREGDLGPIWISVGGGGLGSLGEEVEVTDIFCLLYGLSACFTRAIPYAVSSHGDVLSGFYAKAKPGRENKAVGESENARLTLS